MLEDFKKMHDVLIESMHLSLKNAPKSRLSSEAHNLIQIYGSYFIQFPKFICLRVGGFEEEPMKLPRYALDCFIIVEVCR